MSVVDISLESYNKVLKNIHNDDLKNKLDNFDDPYSIINYVINQKFEIVKEFYNTHIKCNETEEYKKNMTNFIIHAFAPQTNIINNLKNYDKKYGNLNAFLLEKDSELRKQTIDLPSSGGRRKMRKSKKCGCKKGRKGKKGKKGKKMTRRRRRRR